MPSSLNIRAAALLAMVFLISLTLFPARLFSHEPDPNDDSGANSGGPGSNPYTVYSGGNGPGTCSKSGMPNYWVSTYTRELVVQDTDYGYSGLGPDISLTRTWNMPRNSGIAVYGMFGDRWTFSYEMTVDHSGQSQSPVFRYVRLKNGSGQRRIYYIDLSAGAPPMEAQQPSGQHDRLTWYGGYWLFEEKSTRWTYRFDLVSGKNYCRLTSISDCNGNEVTFGYNTDGTLDNITDAALRVTDFTYDADRRCTFMTIPDGRQALFQYDVSGHLIGSTDLLGSQTSFSYDTQHFLTQMTAAAKTTKFTLDAEGKIQSVTDAGNHITQYQLRLHGGIFVTEPPGYQIFYDSTQQGYTSMEMNMALGTWTTTAYTSGRPSEFTDARGSVTRYEYDAGGNLTEITHPLGGVTAFEYDADDNRVSMTNALGDESTFTYDACHHLLSVTSPTGRKISMVYNAEGQLQGVSNAMGKTTGYTYDAFGNVKNVNDAIGNQTTFTYDPDGLRQSALTDARGNTTTYAYDANDRLADILHPALDPLDPDHAHKTFDYDCCVLTAQTDELENTYTYERDALLNVVSLTNPLNHSDERQHDGNDNMTAFTTTLEKTTTYTYDAANRLLTSVNPLEDQVEYGYDKNGNLTSLKDERGKQTFFSYDAENRLLQTTDPIGEKTRIARDALGRVAGTTNARGCVTALTYDADGSLTEKRYDDTVAASYAYDDNVNLVGVTDAAGTMTYTYNDLDLVTGILYADGLSLAFTYDPAGRVNSVNYPGGVTVTYTYDTRNRLVEMEWSATGVEYAYDLAGNLTTESRANGTHTAYTYDAANRPVGISHTKGTQIISMITYARDEMGRTVSETREPFFPPSFASGTATGSYNDVNQLITFSGQEHTYDKDGNLTGVASPAGFSAVYDCENRLTSVTRGGVTTAYTYDGLGNRAKSTTGETVRHFHYDHFGRLVFETDNTKNVTARFIHGGNRIVSMGDASGWYFYHFDKNGNTLAMTDAAGSVAASYNYLPFGAVADRTGSVANPFTHVGAYGVLDEGGGLFFMKHRYYDAHTGRFIQKDPIGFAGGVNLYRYVGNDPVNRIDPTGLEDVVMISDISGEVSVRIKGESETWVPLLGETLPAGAVIQVGKGGKVHLIHKGMNAEVSLAAGNEFSISRDEITRKKKCAGTDDKPVHSVVKRLPTRKVKLDLPPDSRRQIGGTSLDKVAIPAVNRTR